MGWKGSWRWRNSKGSKVRLHVLSLFSSFFFVSSFSFFFFFLFFSWTAELHEDGYLTDEEYARRKNEIIDSMLGNEDAGAARRTTAANPTRSQPAAQSQSRYLMEDEADEEPPAVLEKYVPTSRGQASTKPAPAPAGGRVIMASGPPPTGRVVYVDVNAPQVAASATPNPVQVDAEGRLICFRCGEPIKTKVCEWERKPYDAVCFRLAQVGTDDLKMPNTAVSEPAPVRTYRNRKGEAELAKVAKQNAEYEKKFNKLANQNKAKVEKAKKERERQLERERQKNGK